MHGGMGLAPVERDRAALRTAGVAAAWALMALPAAIGAPPCPFAILFRRPCPGCGMTRAVHLLQEGHLGASLRMNPFAVPVVAVVALLALSTLRATLATGTPLAFYRTRLGRAAIVSACVVHAAALVFWGLRWLGLFGGPVAVW